MDKFDLVPQEFRTDQLRRKRLRLWAYIVLASFLVNSVWIGYIYFIYLKANRDHQKVAKQYQQTQETIQSLMTAKSELNHWQDRIAVLDKLGRYPDFLHITGYLSAHTPPLIVLGGMEFMHIKENSQKRSAKSKTLPKGANMFNIKDKSGKKEDSAIPTVMILKGKAVNYQIVADFLKTLNTSHLFTQIRLKKSQRQTGQKGKAVDFEIECELRRIPMSAGVNYADKSKTQNL